MDMIKLFLFLLFCSFVGVSSASIIDNKLPLKSLGIEDGLSQNYITCLIQSSEGFIWIGTRNGLNRYDGYSFERIDINNKKAVSDYIYCLYEDSAKNIWIGTNQGLVLWDYKTGIIIPVDLGEEQRQVTTIYEGKNEIIWIGTASGILISYHAGSGKMNSYSISGRTFITSIASDDNNSLFIGFRNAGSAHFDLTTHHFILKSTEELFDNHSIIKVLPLSSGGLLLASKSGVYQMKVNGGEEKINEVSLDSHSASQESLSMVIAMEQLNDTIVWLGTDGFGVLSYNLKQETIKPVGFSDQKPVNAVTSFMQDRYGAIWIGTVNAGIQVYNPHLNVFDHWKYEKGNPTGLSSNSVYALDERKNGDILMGLDGGGLNVYEPGKGIYHHYFDSSNELKVLNDVFEDRDNNIWLGTYQHGSKCVRLSPKYQIEPFWLPFDLPIQNLTVKCFLEDHLGQLWIGTSGKGLFQVAADRNSFSHFGLKGQSDIPDIITTIFEDSAYSIWIGTFNKLLKYSPDKARLEVALTESDTLAMHVTSVVESRKGQIWVGSKSGLWEIDVTREFTTHFTEADGLPSNEVNALLFDENGYLWIATDRGLSQMNLQTKAFRNFDKDDGISGMEFNEQSALSASDGKFYFGSTNGVYSFYPNRIVKNLSPPEIIFTKLKLFNNELTVNSADGILAKPVNQTDTVTFNSRQNNITIEYVGLNFTNAPKNQYAYMLQGFDNDWFYAGKIRQASYTNLSAGTYTFRVIASNNDGVWNNTGKSLTILILPPWWRTWWALSIFSIMGLLVVFLINRYILKQVRLKDALKIEKTERANQTKINELKTQFFTNITHEFKTPLTLIMSPLEKILSSMSKGDNRKQQLTSIYNNADRLSRLINQLMDFRKVELGKMRIKVAKYDLIQFLQNITESFEMLTVEKNISFIFHRRPDSLYCWFDADLMEKVIYNLLINALKHTPEYGEIEVVVSRINQSTGSPGNEEAVCIQVIDNGTGIAKEKQGLIFERFYQIENQFNSGSGIGLSLSKSLVEMHHGILSVDSQINVGSAFTIQLPLGNCHFDENEIVEDNLSVEKIPQAYTMKNMDSSQTDWMKTLNKQIGIKKKYTILVVEDDPELRAFIIESMQPYFNVKYAKDGNSGLERAIKEAPDLIISDIMMPGMNGIDFCKKVKSDINISHIPIILLTALNSEDTNIKSLEIGADDYITKPFNVNMLILKVKNLIEIRQSIIKRFKTETAMEPDEIAVTSADELFLQRAIDTVKEHISDSNFKVDQLIEVLGMSRSPFFRKIKALTGLSPSDFIRTIRLKHAAQLLLKSNLNITEVTYDVGFVSPKHFRECFKKQFGQTPSEYIENHT